MTTEDSPVGAPEPAVLVRADGARAEGRWEEAIAGFKQFAAQCPSDPRGRRGWASCLIGAGRFGEVPPVIDPALHENPNDISAWQLRAEAFRHLGDVEELLHCLHAILRLAPGDRDARQEEFHLYDMSGRSAEAFDSLTLLLSIEADAPAEWWIRRAELGESLHRTDDAEESYQHALERAPDRKIELSLRRARLALAGGRPDLALERLSGVPEMATGAEATSAGLLRAQILSQAERGAEAKAAYDAILERDPLCAAALAGAARSRIEEGKHPEARALLRRALERVPRDEELVLLLSEAESGSGDLVAAANAIREGIEILPRSAALWKRSAEIAVARNEWDAAAGDYARAMELDPSSGDVALGAAFVQERRGRIEAALPLYDEAVRRAPGGASGWLRRGLALTAAGRYDAAIESMERALTLDPDVPSAREGKKLAVQKRRDASLGGYALAALRWEASAQRPVTKNDLFVQLHVPFDLLEPVLVAIARETPIDISALAPTDFDHLEAASGRLIVAALDRRPAGVDTHGLTLADVAGLSEPEATLTEVQRRFAYLDAALKVDVRPENLHLSPEIEEMARRALALPPEERTLFGLVRTLKIGLYRARVIKAVERASLAPRTPMASLDLAAHSPEFQSPGNASEAIDGSEFFDPETEPTPEELLAPPDPAEPASVLAPVSWETLGVPQLIVQSSAGNPRAAPRCIGCSGRATIIHACGATVCASCAYHYQTCPKCGHPVSLPLSAPARGAAVLGVALAPNRPMRPTTHSPLPPAHHPARPHSSIPPPARTLAAETPKGSASRLAPDPRGSSPGRGEKLPSPAPEAPSALSARPRREPADDEPRL